MASTNYAPGTRLLIRDEQWRVKRAEMTDRNRVLLVVTGLSPLVRGQERLFLPELEKVEVIDPRRTTFCADDTPSFLSSRLYMESLFRQTPPTDEAIYLGNKAAIDPLPFQLDPASQALGAPRQRILIADSVGLGKTIECGILLSELIARGRGRRILVLAVKSMLAQFQKELWARFTIPLVRLDSVGIQRVRSKIPANHNPFNYYDKTIISIDTLKQESEYRNYLEQTRWDIIVIDEAHNVASRGSGSRSNSQRSHLANILSTRSDTLIMLSATPHDGRRGSFASLMKILDPTAIPNPEDYGPEDIGGLFIRRFKKDIEDQTRGAFLERQIALKKISATPEEEAVFDYLTRLKFDRISNTRRNGAFLFKTVLEKALFSSPAACSETIDNRVKRLQKELKELPENSASAPGVTSDIEKLCQLDALLQQITPEKFSKYRLLVNLLLPKKGELRWSPADAGDRVVIFTERIRTMNFLAERLKEDLSLKDTQIKTLDGSMPDTDMMAVVEEFGNETSPVRLLICSDVAAEGINLHYRCHRLIHFDIPWSLMIFQQRNGRIDRYGQKRQPEIYYLQTEAENKDIRGDARILELLTEKDKEVVESIGDPAIFTHCHDSESEELLTARVIESKQTFEELEARQKQAGETANKAETAGNSDDSQGDSGGDSENADNTDADNTDADNTDADSDDSDLMAWLDQCYIPSTKEPVTAAGSEFPTLFPSDYQYAAGALNLIEGRESIQYEADPKNRTISITPTESMSARLKFLPPNILEGGGGRLHLCADRDKIKEEFDKCREREGSWPKLQYLWRQNPILEYLNDAMLTSFDRRHSPVIQLANLAEDEAVYLTSAVIPNRIGQPVIYRWYGLLYRSGSFVEDRPIEEWIERLRLRDERIPNPMTPIESGELERVLDDVITRTNRLVTEEGARWQSVTTPQLQEQKGKLKALHDGHTRYIDDTFRDDAGNSGSRREQEIRYIEKAISDYERWIEDSMSIENSADIRVIAVVKGVK